MKHWGSAIFPLSLLLALAGLTFWLRYATELPAERHDGKNRHDPDYIITDATLHKINQLPVADEDGRLIGALNMHDLFQAKAI